MKRCEAYDERLVKDVKVKLTYPISDMEKDLIKQGNVYLTFHHFEFEKGYACCVDKTGCTWWLHPESLEV